MRSHKMGRFAGATLLACASWFGLVRCSDDTKPAMLETRAWTFRGAVEEPALFGGRVLALSSSGRVVDASIGSDGGFALSVDGGARYALHFVQGGEFVAVMLFQQNRWSGAETRTLYLPPLRPTGTLGSGLSSAQSSTTSADSARDGTVDLGAIEVEDGAARPANNPAGAVDGDGDGVADLDDPDDDGDDVPDELEDDEGVDASSLGFLVEEVEPKPGDRDVDADVAPRIEFSRAVDVASAQAGIRLEGPGEIALAFEFEDEGREVTLLPSAPLLEGQSYSLIISSSVASAAGEVLGRTQRISFCVECEADMPFRVKKVYPASGRRNVERAVKLEVEFTRELDVATASVAAGAFRLLGPDGAPVAGELTVEDEELEFRPAAPLSPDSRYVIELGQNLRSRDGEGLPSALRLSFETGTELDRPGRSPNENSDRDAGVRERRDGGEDREEWDAGAGRDSGREGGRPDSGSGRDAGRSDAGSERPDD